ncbi:MAG: SEC-C domain-containing protein [Syntrophobacteraceae bacterium]|jgi:hypothetical protein|nr:SEC-C domain-containing protein [Syntrophobacteraceae bacterium]
MDDSLIWSEAALTLQTASPHPEVQPWAVATLLRLYPAAGGARMSEWLGGPHADVATVALKHLLQEPHPSPDLVPHLKDLFLSRKTELSALAMRVAGHWRIPELTLWIQEKILENQPLSPDQIAAMIEALGLIPGESAHDLLKATESSMADKRSALWMSYYHALLSHGKREDVDTLVRLYTDPREDEARRRNAMQILAHRADPVLNPSDLLFVNVEPIQKHLAARLDLALDAAAERGAPGDAILRELRPYLDVFRPENASMGWELLRSAVEAFEDLSGIQRNVALSAIEAQGRCKPSSEESYGLAGLGLCAFVSGLMERAFPVPEADAPWEQRLAFVLTDHFLRPVEPGMLESIVRDAPRTELLPRLMEALSTLPFSWKTFQAMEMLGIMGAAESGGAMVRALQRLRDPSFLEIAERALKRTGPSGAAAVVPLLDTASSPERALALRVLASCPTHGAVSAVVSRFSKLFEEESALLLEAVEDMGSERFLPLLEKEYRPGEWKTARALLQLGRIHQCELKSRSDLEREAADHERMLRRQEALLTRGFRDWPDRVELTLSCARCGKTYSYAVREIHLHPHRKTELETESPGGPPYHHGMVICDDLRCKNCNAMNELTVTRETLGQITAESLKLLALHRSKASPPPYYPVKHVETGEKEGQPRSLVDLEREHTDAALRHGTQPQAQIALAKFHEYVKAYPMARRSYLKALDLDPRALEAMAGLTRLDQAEGRLEEAYDWIDRCYRDLTEGRIYTAKDSRQFKKAVREKRREIARGLGIQPEEAPVKVRFQIESSGFPKNRPCPCGSGKKYKLCCMEKDETLSKKE